MLDGTLKAKTMSLSALLTLTCLQAIISTQRSAKELLSSHSAAKIPDPAPSQATHMGALSRSRSNRKANRALGRTACSTTQLTVQDIRTTPVLPATQTLRLLHKSMTHKIRSLVVSAVEIHRAAGSLEWELPWTCLEFTALGSAQNRLLTLCSPLTVIKARKCVS